MMIQRMPAIFVSASVVTLLMASPAGAEIVFDLTSLRGNSSN